jgi:hypothetical protein
LTRKDSNIFYFPSFLIRRLIFIMIPIMMINYPAQGLQTWLLITVFYIIYFDGSTRFTLQGDNTLSNINDVFCLIQIYHYMCFTSFNQNYMAQFQLGFSMVINMALMMAINVGVMIYKSINDGRRLRRLKAVKENKLEVFNRLKELKQFKTTHLKKYDNKMKSWRKETRLKISE